MCHLVVTTNDTHVTSVYGASLVTTNNTTIFEYKHPINISQYFIVYMQMNVLK
jgi:hypothetical protein